MDKNELLKTNETNLNRVISWVQIVDDKAKFVFSLILVALGYMLSQVKPFVTVYTHIAEYKSSCCLFLFVFLIITMVSSLFVSFINIVLIIYPKRKPYTGKDSIFYYESIASMETDHYKELMESLSEEDALSNYIDQTYNVSKVVKKKFDQLSTSISYFLISLASLIVFTVTVQATVNIINTTH